MPVFSAFRAFVVSCLIALTFGSGARASYYYGNYGYNPYWAAQQNYYCQVYLSYMQQAAEAQKRVLEEQKRAEVEAQRRAYSWQVLPEKDERPDFSDDYAYLLETKRQATFGQVASQALVPEYVEAPYRNQFKTRVYFTATAKPDKNGSIPAVNADAKALVVIMSGAGTDKSGGATSVYTANKWASLGYSTLSFDPPFHKDGAVSDYIKNTDAFVGWVYSLIKKHQVPGQPVILVGHSFGSKVILELLERDPSLADKVIVSSPGPIDDQTLWYYKTVAAQKIKDKAGLKVNEAGARFIKSVSDGFISDKADQYVNYNGSYYFLSSRNLDPSLKNPRLKFYFVIGTEDEFVPPGYDIGAAMRKKVSGAQVKLVKGAGHLIWQAKDENGNDVMTRYLLEIMGEDIAKEKEIKAAWSQKQKIQPVDQVAQTYLLNRHFKAWFDKKIGYSRLAALSQPHSQDEARQEAQKILALYQDEVNARRQAMYQNMKADPVFASAHQELLGQIGKKGFQPTKLISAYFNYLEEQK